MKILKIGRFALGHLQISDVVINRQPLVDSIQRIQSFNRFHSTSCELPNLEIYEALKNADAIKYFLRVEIGACPLDLFIAFNQDLAPFESNVVYEVQNRKPLILKIPEQFQGSRGVLLFDSLENVQMTEKEEIYEITVPHLRLVEIPESAIILTEADSLIQRKKIRIQLAAGNDSTSTYLFTPSIHTHYVGPVCFDLAGELSIRRLIETLVVSFPLSEVDHSEKFDIVNVN